MLTKEIKSNDSLEFVMNLLRPTSGNWEGPIRSWIFRGQREYNWGLIPSVFRKETINNWSDLAFEDQISLPEFMEKELKLIRRFIKIADSVGLKVPGDCFEFRIKNGYGTAEWPPNKYMEIFAIAQHHGLPTRLLDFTHDAYTAAFFSTIECLEKPDVDGEMAIWAFNIGKYYDLLDECERSIQLVSVPTHDNHYLNAQKGLFIYDKKLHDHWNGLKSLKEININLENVINSDLDIVCKRTSAEIKPIILKISFSKHLCKKLLEKLIEEGYHYASLMPSYHKVIHQLKLEEQIKTKRF